MFISYDKKNISKVHEWRIGDDRVKSKIEIDPATQMDAGVYECTADNMYSIDRRSFKTDFSIAFDWSLGHRLQMYFVHITILCFKFTIYKQTLSLTTFQMFFQISDYFLQ